MDSQNGNFPLDQNIIKYDSSFFLNYFNLLQDLYIFLSNREITESEIDELNEFIKKFLFEYDLDPKNVLKIMTSDSKNMTSYSSLIGFFYQYGIGCEVDEIKAFETYFNVVKNNKNETNNICNDKVKELNEIVTQYFYSMLLYKDIILNIRNNYKLHIKHAEKGDNVSQYYIGNCYYSGIKVKKNHNKVIEWYSKSSEGGNIKAMYDLGCCYKYGYGVAKNKKKAFELYLKSAEGGYKYALYELGNCYHYGKCIFKDEIKAFEFYIKAAEKGHISSQYLVANYYYDGIYIPKNEEKGFYWYRKAAINGDANAQFKLAEYYANRNESKAFKWYMELANESRLKATYQVAKCYRDGIGIDKNLEEATNWIKKYETSRYYGKPKITLDEFLNGSNIKVSSIPSYVYTEM
ncbi:hypothetical protein RclHR1_01110006 [Rhizophagus clarus]|uniref:Kinase-like domain-containing protein n=1 Tax=Rhizophagus clarus TaxID=94130 RepID=A0A2Z6QIC3_9GLOM|nr:hypothetical protein RclHR1_01110006 [Rhizophagus clarus]GES74541.1 kinase-like domain-containing protein [Rhizophagus clarus]